MSFGRPWSLVHAAFDWVGCRIQTFWQAQPSSTRLRHRFSCVLPTTQDRSQQAKLVILRTRFDDLGGSGQLVWVGEETPAPPESRTLWGRVAHGQHLLVCTKPQTGCTAFTTLKCLRRLRRRTHGGTMVAPFRCPWPRKKAFITSLPGKAPAAPHFLHFAHCAGEHQESGITQTGGRLSPDSIPALVLSDKVLYRQLKDKINNRKSSEMAYLVPPYRHYGKERTEWHVPEGNGRAQAEPH
eukprot:gene18885-biopygen19001